jgi:putative acetyltransferase
VSPPPAPEPVIRPEQPGEGSLIEKVVAAAFDPGEVESRLVASLRACPAFIAELSLVAVLDGNIIGHVLLTRSELLDESHRQHPVLVLSPLSVLPQQQRRGIGSALVTHALQRADAMQEQIVVLQGSPAYYPRFGFRDSRTLGITMALPDWAPPQAGMACPLSTYQPTTRGRLLETQPFLELS